MKRLFYILASLEKDPGVFHEPRFVRLVDLVKKEYENKIKFSKCLIKVEKQIDFEYLPHFYSIGTFVMFYILNANCN